MDDFDIDGPGLVLTAEFETSSEETDSYVGSVSIFGIQILLVV